MATFWISLSALSGIFALWGFFRSEEPWQWLGIMAALFLILFYLTEAGS